MGKTDPYLHDLYQQLHDSPLQRKFRRLAPWPCGVVFIQHPSMDYEEIRRHFRLMRDLGFTCLKQCQVCRGTDKRRVMNIALDEGIIPWWYGQAGWEEPTPERLQALGLPPDTPVEALETNAAWLARQDRVMRERIDREAERRSDRRAAGADGPPTLKRPADWVPSVQPTFNFELDETTQPLFLDWLKRRYGTIGALNRAWNTDHCMIPGPRGHGDSGDGGEAFGWDSWEQLASEMPDVVNRNFREYRRTRDVLRFKADNYLNWLRDRLDRAIEADPVAPQRAGGEMGLFLPFASRGTDMEGIAGLMTDRGSFYPSFHLAWHFEEVDFETPRTFYMQSSLSTDWFKGGWNASWESTGGPQQMTGHKAPFVPEVRDKKPGFTVDDGCMRQLMLSWIAGGYRGFGQWAWTMRTAGWEGGEYGLLDRNYRVTDRAVAAGKIAKACRRLRRELWEARKEPLVGVFQDWDMEAIWAACSRGGRDFFKNEPIRARIGASRALINANIPWEHVTGRNLRAGLAPRYRAILLPAALAVDPELLDLLAGYVREGGRVVLDAPGAWYDYYGRVLQTDDGSPFERLFGCRLADFQYSRETTRPWRIGGQPVHGTTFDLQPTTAGVLAEFDHSRPDRPRPAVTEHRLGRGAAVLLAFEATRACWRPGHTLMEDWVVRYTLDGIEAPYACAGAPVYRLAAPAADHYFLMNDGEEREVTLDTKAFRYTAVEDPVEEQALKIGAPVLLPDHSARWLRFVK